MGVGFGSLLGETMQETDYLIKSPANAARLMEAINEIEAMITADSQKEGESE